MDICYYISDLNGEEKLLECFPNMNWKKKKKNQKEFRIEKVIKRKGDKLYVKWKGYIWIVKRGIT